MEALVEALLKSFDNLPEAAKREAAVEILKRSVMFDLPVLSDEAFLQSADELFLKLDKHESNHA
ncbi:MAG: hypothetical protein HYX73_08260 [Acidobacteria bacterium]|nr:hypothetical protein [Acidobacteriota bacterium]